MSQTTLIGFVLFDILVILVVARLLGSVMERIGQPRVVGEILAGVVLGPTLLGPTLWPEFVAPGWLDCAASNPGLCLFPPEAREVIGVIGQIGLLLFSFLSGVTLDSRVARAEARSVTGIGLGIVLIPLGFGFLIGPLVSGPELRAASGTEITFSLFVGAVLAVTALPVMVRILEEKGLFSSRLGVLATASAAVATVAMFVAASVAVSLGSPDSSMTSSLVGIAGYLILAVPGFWWLRRSRVQIGFLAAMALVLLSGLLSHMVGLSVVVGAFLAGIGLGGRTAIKDRAEATLGTMTRVALLPLFLAFSGFATDFTDLDATTFVALLILLVSAVASKIIAGAGTGRLFGLSWNEGATIGILANCRGLLVLVVALMGIESGVVTPRFQAVAVAIALVTTAMTGPLTDLASRSSADK